MRINEKIKVRQVVGENIVIMPGSQSTDMTRVVALNESALLLYNTLKGQEFELEDVAQALLKEYDVAETNARTDARAWVDEMKKNNLIA